MLHGSRAKLTAINSMMITRKEGQENWRAQKTEPSFFNLWQTFNLCFSSFKLNDMLKKTKKISQHLQVAGTM